MGFKDYLSKYVQTETPKADSDTGEFPVQSAKAIPQKSVMSGMGVTTVPASYIPAPGGMASSSADQNIINELNAAAEASKHSEYAAFLKALDSLKAMPNESQRVMTALSVLQGMQGIIPQAVVAAVDDRLALVDAERDGFEAAYKQAVEQSVTGVNQQVADIEAQVTAKQAEIEALQQKRIALKQEASTAQIKLESDRATFLASHNVVHQTLNNERERIITNLPH